MSPFRFFHGQEKKRQPHTFLSWAFRYFYSSYSFNNQNRHNFLTNHSIICNMFLKSSSHRMVKILGCNLNERMNRRLSSKNYGYLFIIRYFFCYQIIKNLRYHTICSFLSLCVCVWCLPALKCINMNQISISDHMSSKIRSNVNIWSNIWSSDSQYLTKCQYLGNGQYLVKCQAISEHMSIFERMSVNILSNVNIWLDLNS